MLTREMHVLQQSRVELEKHMEKLVIEREELKKTIEQAKKMKSEEARVSAGEWLHLMMSSIFERRFSWLEWDSLVYKLNILETGVVFVSNCTFVDRMKALLASGAIAMTGFYCITVAMLT